MEFHSQEWVDAYKEAINGSPERAKKAGKVTMNTRYILLDCPGGVDKYETWQFVKGEVVEAKMEEKPAPSDYRKIPFNKDEFLFGMTAPYELFAKRHRGEISDMALQVHREWKVEGPKMKLLTMGGFLGWWGDIGRKLPTEF